MTSITLLPTTVLFLLLQSITASSLTNFTFNGFQNVDLSLSGAAEITSTGVLHLNHGIDIGHAFFPSPLRLKTHVSSNSSNSSALSFSTTFVVWCDSGSVAFVLSPTKDISGAQPGEYFGLFNNTNNGTSSNHIVAVELHTYEDDNVGIDVNSVRPINYTSRKYSVYQTGIQVWIKYDGRRKEMFVTVSDGVDGKPSVPLLVSPIDLSSIMLHDVYVGFSSSSSSRTNIRGWSFCINGQETPLDLNGLPKISEIPDSSTFFDVSNFPSGVRLILVAVVAPVFVLIFILVAVTAVIRRRRRRRRKFAEILENWEIEYGPHRISYKELYKATNGFNNDNILGSGGFGVVYKGVLQKSNMVVAVKKISHKSQQGMREFVAEIVSLGRLRHRNLVQLLGYCRREGELLLVYDYMPNGSLEKYLFFSDNGGVAPSTLNWNQRFQIVKGIATGLLYLHEQWEQVVIHRDIKASNVLLDDEFNGRLSDFGLARLYQHGSNPQTTCLVGTFGYLAPELVKTSKATTNTDVYAFGIFLLEVVCGRRPTETRVVASEDMMLVDWVVQCWKKDEMLSVVDPKLRGDYEVVEIEMVLKLGLLCSHPEPTSRPSIRQVMQILDGVALLPHITPSNLSVASLTMQKNEGFDDFSMSSSLIVHNSSQLEDESSPAEASHLSTMQQRQFT